MHSSSSFLATSTPIILVLMVQLVRSSERKLVLQLVLPYISSTSTLVACMFIYIEMRRCYFNDVHLDTRSTNLK